MTNGQVRYNCTIIDLYDRSVVASENGKFITSDLAIRTLDKAIHAAHCDTSNLILHSDKELDDAIYQFAYSWYNCIRPHSYNGYLTPFEKRCMVIE